MKKSITTRIRITKNGKMVHRTLGVGHFRTRKTSKAIRHKRQTNQILLSKHAVLTY